MKTPVQDQEFIKQILAKAKNKQSQKKCAKSGNQKYVLYRYSRPGN